MEFKQREDEMNDNPDKAYDALFQSYEESNMRIKELEVQCGHFRLTISKLESLLVQAGLNVTELQAEITRLREGGCAREQGASQWCAEAQRLAEDAAILDWMADNEIVESIPHSDFDIHDNAGEIVLDDGREGEPTVEDYRLALRHLIRAAMDEKRNDDSGL